MLRVADRGGASGVGFFLFGLPAADRGFDLAPHAEGVVVAVVLGVERAGDGGVEGIVQAVFVDQVFCDVFGIVMHGRSGTFLVCRLGL